MAGTDAGAVFVRVLPDARGFGAALSGGVNSALRGVEGKMQGFLSGLGRGASATGSFLTKAITLPIVGIGAAATLSAVRYADAFTKIGALSNASAKQVGEWKKEVLGLAGETAKAPAELADALYFLASAGLKVSDIMPTLEASAKASAAGLGETSDIAKITAQALNVYAKSGLKAADVTDTLVAAVKAGTAAPEEFSGALGRILPIAAKAGVSFQEVAASLAALSNIGLDVNEGVTAMRGLLQALEAPGTQAAKTLKEVGISADEMRKAISEQGILGALRLLNDATNGNIDTMRKIVPNIRALTGEFGLTGQNASKVADIFHQVENSTGELDKAFRKTQQGPMFKFEQAMAKLRVAGIKLGTALIPIVTKVADFIGRMADKFNSLSPKMQHNILMWAGIAAAAGPALKILGGGIGVLSRLVGLMKILGGTGGAAAKAVGAVAGAGAGLEAAGGAAAGAAGAFLGAALPLGLLGTLAVGAAIGAIKLKNELNNAHNTVKLLPPGLNEVTQSTKLLSHAAGYDVPRSFVDQNKAVQGGNKVLQEAQQAHANYLHSIGLSTTAQRTFDQWMINGTRTARDNAQVIATLYGQIGRYHGSLTDLQKAQIQHMLATGQVTRAENVLVGVLNNAKQAANGASGANKKAAGTAQNLANQNQNVSTASKNATGSLNAMTGATNRQANAAGNAVGRSHAMATAIHAVQNAAASAANAVLNLVGAIFKMHSKQITIGVNYKSTGSPPRYSQAKGGVFAAGGLQFISPGGVPFIAGEAAYPTPIGRGAEVVTSRGVEPLAADHLQRIAQYQAQYMREYVADAVRAGRPVTERILIGEVKIRGRDLVATAELERLWAR